MRPVSFGAQQARDAIAEAKFQEIERASREYDLATMMGEFVPGTFTELRTLNVGSSTLTQTQQVLATLIADLARGGSKRSN